MKPESTIHRRGFVGQLVRCGRRRGPLDVRDACRGCQDSGADDWIKEVKGSHRCLFDFPQHKNGMPLLHILNYLNTYATAYKTGAGRGRRRRNVLQRGQPGQHFAGVQ